MDTHGPNVVRVSLDLLNFLEGVVVIDVQRHIIACGDNPLLPGDELRVADWEHSDLDLLDQSLGVVVIEEQITGVQARQHPWLRGVEVDLYVF